jgi:hypothetical protein
VVKTRLQTDAALRSASILTGAKVIIQQDGPATLFGA